jgi:hypothetical protein
MAYPARPAKYFQLSGSLSKYQISASGHILESNSAAPRRHSGVIVARTLSLLD